MELTLMRFFRAMRNPRTLTSQAALLTGFLVIGLLQTLAGAAQGAVTSGQSIFASPDEAVAALVDAAKKSDLKRMFAILGPGSEALIRSGDPNADAIGRQKFVEQYDSQHKVVEDSAGHDSLLVGANNWPLPIPLVQVKDGWRFDARAGAQQIIDRRIGRNEIAAIRVTLTYVDAQRDYFERRKQEGTTGEYAQRLVSTPNQHDGLYWPAAVGEPESPFGPLVAQAVDEGYPGDIAAGRQIPYQGYYFRVLVGQGENAPDGAKDYIENGRMTGGFALVAWPAEYGSSGIMTFVVDQDGVVFQKNLGKGTAALAAAMTRFDADVSWARVDVTNE
jgi:hypothetical protein